jgi:transposase
VPRATVYESAELRELRCRYKRLEQENEVLRRVAAFFARALIERVAELARSPGMC